MELILKRNIKCISRTSISSTNTQFYSSFLLSEHRGLKSAHLVINSFNYIELTCKNKNVKITGNDNNCSILCTYSEISTTLHFIGIKESDIYSEQLEYPSSLSTQGIQDFNIQIMIPKSTSYNNIQNIAPIIPISMLHKNCLNETI